MRPMSLAKAFTRRLSWSTDPRHRLLISHRLRKARIATCARTFVDARPPDRSEAAAGAIEDGDAVASLAAL